MELKNKAQYLSQVATTEQAISKQICKHLAKKLAQKIPKGMRWII